MNVAAIVRSMSERMPWEVGQQVFADSELPKGQGWARTVARYEKQEVADTQAAALQTALRQHLMCGEKLSRFYRVPKGQMADLRKLALTAPIGNDRLAEVYPLVLTEEEIAKEFPHPHRLVAIEATDDGVGMVFASSRAIVYRADLDASELSEEVAEALSGFDEITVVKHRKHEAFDVVWIPHEGDLVDVRVDLPKGMSIEVAGVAHERTKAALAGVMGFDVLQSPINLFPLIDGIYKTPNEGVVVEMAFGTTTASLKHEKMRRAGSCLRLEKYHVGGKAALQSEIEPYRLSVQWPGTQAGDTRPEMSLNSSARVKGSTLPVLLDVVIRKCVGVADYEMVRSRIQTALYKITQDNLSADK